MTPKVAISIVLDDEGRISFQATSKNMVTLLGMMELAKKIVLNQKDVKEESPILTPNGIN